MIGSLLQEKVKRSQKDWKTNPQLDHPAKKVCKRVSRSHQRNQIRNRKRSQRISHKNE